MLNIKLSTINICSVLPCTDAKQLRAMLLYSRPCLFAFVDSIRMKFVMNKCFKKTM